MPTNVVKPISFVLLAIVLFINVSCQSVQSESINETAVAQIETSVSQTVTAVPTHTPYATYTPNATYTPFPTATSFPTYTPLPTLTSNPTYTPFPTNTVLPTETFAPTSLPTNTPAPSTAANPVSTPATSTEGSDPKSSLLTKIEQTLANIDSYQFMIKPREIPEFDFQRTKYFPADCQAVINLRNEIITPYPIAQPISDPILENAYNVYLFAINQFASVTQEWTDVCQSILVNGETHTFINDLTFGLIAQGILEPINLLNQTANSLRE